MRNTDVPQFVACPVSCEGFKCGGHRSDSLTDLTAKVVPSRNPRGVVMTIVPDEDELQVEARLQLNEINGVKLGQSARVRFSAFDARTTPELNGAVSYVSADVSQDPRTAASFYTV